MYALAILEMIGVAWFYGKFFEELKYSFIACICRFLSGVKSLMRDIKFMLGIDLGLYWKVCWAFIVPGSLSFFFIYYITRFPVVAYAGVPLPQAAVCEY